MKRDETALQWAHLLQLQGSVSLQGVGTQIYVKLPNDKIVPAGVASICFEDDDPDNLCIIIEAAKTVTPRKRNPLWVKGMIGPLI